MQELAAGDEAQTQLLNTAGVLALADTQQLLRRKANKDRTLPALLELLELSDFPKDDIVRRLIQKADLKHPGGGSKSCLTEVGSND